VEETGCEQPPIRAEVRRHENRRDHDDLGLTEDEVRARWERYFQSLRVGKTSSPTGE
jgi:hypothetical protein